MRIDNNDFENRVKSALSEEFSLPSSAESTLFARAEELLSAKRERVQLREAKWEESRRARTQRWARLRELFTFEPELPAAIATFAVLLLAFFALHSGTRRGVELEKSAFAKNGDVFENYDAQARAERLAYEKEIEDAHRDTSGGI